MIYVARDFARLRAGVLLSSAAAWAAMAAMPERSCHCPIRPAAGSLASVLGSRSAASMALGWMVMLVAMMAPVTTPALYHIRITTFVRRRWRSSALFLLGYGLVWAVAGVVLTGVQAAAGWLAPGSYGPALAVGLAAFVWQASPGKQRCLNRCHAHRPLAAFGMAADRDALLMGLEHGVWCVGSCWAIMLFPMLLPVGGLAAMAAVTLLMLSERLDPPKAPAWRLRGFQTSWRWLRLRLLGPRGTYSPDARRLPS